MKVKRERGLLLHMKLCRNGIYVLFALLVGYVHALDILKTNNTDSLNLPSSWVGGIVPGPNDVAVWSNVVTAANTPSLDANLQVAGIRILNPGGAVGLTPVTINLGGVTPNSTDDMFTYSGTAVANGNIVTFSGKTMPTGVTSARQYVVTNATATTYQIADGIGGTLVNFTANGANVTNNVQPALIIGSSGIDLSNAAQNLSSLGVTLSLSANQTWSVKASRGLDSNNNSNNSGFPVLNNGYTVTVSNGASSQVDLGNYHGAGGLVKNGAGSLYMAGVNTYTGNVVVTAGTMNGGNDANAFGSGASALTLSGGTLTAKANNPRNFARNTTVSGNCGFYNNNSTDTGGQTYGFGTLSIGACTFTVTHKSGGTVGSLTFGATTLTGDAIFEVSTRSDNLLVLGAVSGNYGMTKTGVGILKLVGDNSYSGETVISNGVLQLDNLASTRLNPEAALNVCANGTFFDAYTTARRLTNVVVCGAGTLMSAVTNSCFVVTGTVAPGDNGIGTLNVATGCVQVATGATYFLEIGGTPDAPVSDSVALSGSNSTVNFDGAWTLNIAKVGTVQPYNRQFVLFDYTGANPPSLGTPTVTYASGTEWYGGQVRLDSANSRIVLTFSTGTMISIF